MRLVAGEQEALPDLIDQLWDLIGSYLPPPEPLRLAGRVPATGAESLEAHDNAERAIRAFAVEASERGYAATTVAQILARAQMSATTFYNQFGGKEDAMLAAIDSAGAQMGAAMRPAIRRASDWATAVRAAIGAVFNFLASRPALARLVLVEAYVAGPAALQRRLGHLQPLEALLAEGRDQAEEAPEITEELISGVFYSLSRRRIREDSPQALPGLAPLCTYLALAPYLGAERACEVANAAAGRRRAE
jgi:AcrR family transcriptional regulator